MTKKSHKNNWMHSRCECLNVLLVFFLEAESLGTHTFALYDGLIEFTFL